MDLDSREFSLKELTSEAIELAKVKATGKRLELKLDYDPNLPITEISNLHYTEGGPYFEDYKNCGYSNEWLH